MDEVTQNFHKQRLLQAVQTLQKEAHDTNSWTPAMQNKYENIDQKATQIMLAAEENCLPKFKTLRTWSVEMKMLGLQLRYYNRYLLYLSNRNISKATLVRLSTQANIPFQTLDKTSVQNQLQQTRTTLSQVKKQHASNRKSYLQQLAREYTQEGKVEAKKNYPIYPRRGETKKSPLPHTSRSRERSQHLPSKINGTPQSLSKSLIFPN